MTDQKPAVVLVHGAFAESASWNGVIKQLHQNGVESIAVANPLRSLAGDAAYLRDVIASVGRPVVLVGHSYGGLVISEASSGNDAVSALVYVNAFVPDIGESVFDILGGSGSALDVPDPTAVLPHLPVTLARLPSMRTWHGCVSPRSRPRATCRR